MVNGHEENVLINSGSTLYKCSLVVSRGDMLLELHGSIALNIRLSKDLLMGEELIYTGEDGILRVLHPILLLNMDGRITRLAYGDNDTNVIKLPRG